MCGHVDPSRVRNLIHDTLFTYIYYSISICIHSGSIICANSILLTAAHCAGIFIQSGIFLGGTTVDGSSGSTFYEVESELPNPNYGTCNFNFTIIASWHHMNIFITKLFMTCVVSEFITDIDTDANGT